MVLIQVLPWVDRTKFCISKSVNVLNSSDMASLVDVDKSSVVAGLFCSDRKIIWAFWLNSLVDRIVCSFSGLFDPNIAQTSAADVITLAPALSRLLGPDDRALVIGPGTANTSLFSSRASCAVMSDPDLASASGTMVAWASPAIIRLRAGKWCLSGGVAAGYSLIIAPPDRIISLASGRCLVG